MFKVLNETPPDKLEAALSPLLDIDGVLRFLAVDNALVNTDGYWTRASDYSIYQDVKGRFHVIPHDMNEALINEGGRGGRGPGGPPPDFGRGGPGGPPPPGLGGPGGPPPGMGPRGGRGFGPGGGGPTLDPLIGLDDPSKPLRSKLLAVPALRTRYLAYVRDIAETWLDWKKLGPMARTYQDLIREEVKLDTRKLYSTEAFEAGLETGDQSPEEIRRRAARISPESHRSEGAVEVAFPSDGRGSTRPSRGVLPAAARVPAAVASRRSPWTTRPTTVTIPGSTARRRGYGSSRRCSSASSPDWRCTRCCRWWCCRGVRERPCRRSAGRGVPRRRRSQLKAAAAVRPAVLIKHAG